MKHKVQMIVKYEVKQPFISQYQEVVTNIFRMLPAYEAIDCNVIQTDTEPNQIIETYMLPTEAHYHALKKLRKSKKHSVFGCLDQIIIGGLKQMECLAFKK